MKSSKFIIPIAVITCFALTSCNKNAGLLKRETYNQKVDTLTELTSTLENINKAQRNEAGSFNIDKGTMRIKFNLVASGSFYLFETIPGGTTQVININNMNLVLSDTIDVKWDMEHEYMGVSNLNNENLFIKKVDGEWRTYFVKTVAGNKYYRPISSEWFDALNFKDPKNYFMYAMMDNTGSFSRTDESNTTIIQGAGFDISGFGYDLIEMLKPELESTNGNYHFYVVNTLAPGLITSDDLRTDFLDLPLKTVIDEIMDYQKEASNPVIPMKANYTKNEKGDGVSINLGIDHVDLTKSKEIFDELSVIFDDPSLKDEVFTSGSGNISTDYFVNFKDNFIHQQELTLDFNNANLQLVTPYADNQYTYINMKNINAHGYVNQSVELGKCDYQEPDTSGYLALPPIPVHK